MLRRKIQQNRQHAVKKTCMHSVQQPKKDSILVYMLVYILACIVPAGQCERAVHARAAAQGEHAVA